jgi:vacuolar protein sorting-associated protein 13A/C
VINEATIRIQITQIKEQRLWPYQIKNLTDKAINFYQKVSLLRTISDFQDAIRWERESGRDPGTSTGYNSYRLTPRSRMCYAWDYPAARDRALVLEIDGRQRAIKLEEIGTLPPMKISENKSIGFDIWASDDGTTQHLDIKYYVETSQSLYRSRTNASSASLRSQSAQSEDQSFVVNKKAVSDRVKSSVRILLKEGIGISVINSAKSMELMYLTFQDIRIKVRETETEYTSSLEVRWIEIDNQLFGGFYPIILYPTVVPKTEKELADHPIFSISGSLLKDPEHGVVRFKYLQVLLQEMTAEADEDFVWALLETVQSVVSSFHIEDDYKNYSIADAPVQDSSEVVEASGGNLYFELFLLHPVQLNLSFVRTEAINSEPTLLKE